MKVEADGGLSQSYRHPKAGSGRWRLDEATLKPIGTYPPAPPALPRHLLEPESSFPGMRVRLKTGRGQAPEPGLRYVRRWETLGPNRDRPRKQAPPPSELRLYVVRDGE